jgi:hypothetical protein
MKTLISVAMYPGSAWFTRIAVALLTAGLACPVHAALGGNPDSVVVDQEQMKAGLTVSKAANYQVDEIKTASGTVVREFISPAGRVFGVAWQGPFVPDLSRLLGSYFQQYSAAASQQQQVSSGRRSLNIQTPGLVVQSSGHMRAYSGRAYDPTLVPGGVDPDEVH